MTGRIRTQEAERVGWILLDHAARRNAMSLAMWQELAAVAEAFDADPGIRCLVLRGEGSAAFCAGADIGEFDKGASARDANLAYASVAKAAMARLQAVRKPTVAMIEGYCIGGGVALALACDLRIAAASARFGIPAARLGLGYDPEGLARLADLVGPSQAKRLLFTAAQFPAEEALRIGLVDEVHEPPALAGAVEALAATIAASAPLTVAAAKRAVDAATSGADLGESAREAAACFDSGDFVEGCRAFQEKRRPVFEGR